MPVQLSKLFPDPWIALLHNPDQAQWAMASCRNSKRLVLCTDGKMLFSL